MTFGSLFAGIGGFDLGFERAGMRCVWQVELDEYCRRVLAKHWPDVRRWDDVRTFAQDDPDQWRCDVICGGFPCQDISVAGKRVGLSGERSGLWWEYARVIRVLRPRFVVVENVPGILAPTEPGRPAPLGCVLGELARIGYDAEWESIPASAFGSTQERFRVFIIAHDARPRREELHVPALAARAGQHHRILDADDPHLKGDRTGLRTLSAGRRPEGQGTADALGNADGVDSDTNGIVIGTGWPGRTAALRQERYPAWENHTVVKRNKRRQRPAENSDESGEREPSGEPDRRDSPFVGSGWWGTEPEMVRMVYGLSRRLVRPAIRGLGNAVVPQVAEWIARRILDADELRQAAV